jgi:ATPase subunit of ABC transporter with duplicated ATPase domains
VRKIHEELLATRTCYEQLYAPVQKVASEAAVAAGSSHSLRLEFHAYISSVKFRDDFFDFIRRNRKGTFYGEDESRKAVLDILNAHDLGTTDGVVAFTDAICAALVEYDRDGVKEKIAVEPQLRQGKTVQELYDFLYGMQYLDVRYTLKLGGKDISHLSPGEKGALLLVFYLLLDTAETPIIIDQPEQNLDNESVVRLLVDCIRRARDRRQVVIVTHNPNLAVFCDADQVIHCKIDKADGNRITYKAGALEDYEINQISVTVLEGTYPAFDNRRKKYQQPQVEYGTVSESTA